MNRQCSLPLHTLITDAVETCGGSNRLQSLLNRLCICASIETHARYVQYRVEKRNKEGHMDGFPADFSTVVSADNLDYIHSYFQVYSENQRCSWNGITVQIVQPKCTTLVDSTH